MNNPEYWRLTNGEVIRQSVIEWENPLGVENLRKLIKSGDVIGQGSFDMQGKIDFVYWMPAKISPPKAV